MTPPNSKPPQIEDDTFLLTFFQDPPPGPDLTARVMAEIILLPQPSPTRDFPLPTLFPLLFLSLSFALFATSLLANVVDLRTSLECLQQIVFLKNLAQGITWTLSFLPTYTLLPPSVLIPTSLVLPTGFLFIPKIYHKRRGSHDPQV